jgi:hypothetical protein
MGRTLLAIVGLVAFLSGARGALAFTTYPLDPVITFDRQADPDQLSDDAKTTNLEEQLSGCPADSPAGSGFSFPDHRRPTPRTAHLSSSQVRYSCRANTGKSTPANGECLTSVHPGSGADRQKTAQIRRSHTQHQTTVVRHFGTPGPVSSDDRDAPKAGRGGSTPRRRLLDKRHPEPRARVPPVRLNFLRRQADDRLLRLPFAIIIAAG